jgi:hypothetical protein
MVLRGVREKIVSLINIQKPGWISVKLTLCQYYKKSSP